MLKHSHGNPGPRACFSTRFTVVKSATTAIETSSIHPTSCGWLTLVKHVGCIGQVAPQSPHPSGSCHTSATPARSTSLHPAPCYGRCAQACGISNVEGSGAHHVQEILSPMPCSLCRHTAHQQQCQRLHHLGAKRQRHTACACKSLCFLPQAISRQGACQAAPAPRDQAASKHFQGIPQQLNSGRTYQPKPRNREHAWIRDQRASVAQQSCR